MNGKTITLAALAASLMLGTSASASFARPDRGQFGGPERMFIHLLQQADTNKDGKISKEEAKASQEKMFAAVDADSDGVLTPGEFRKHREAMRTAMREERKADAAKDDAGKDKLAPDTAAAPTPPGDEQAKADEDRPGKHHEWRHKGEHGPRGDKHGERHAGRGDDRHERHGMGHGPKRGMGMMRMIDTDENGQVSKEEASAAADKMFERMDTNKDRVISADDLPKAHFWR